MIDLLAGTSGYMKLAFIFFMLFIVITLIRVVVKGIDVMVFILSGAVVTLLIAMKVVIDD